MRSLQMLCNIRIRGVIVNSIVRKQAELKNEVLDLVEEAVRIAGNKHMLAKILNVRYQTVQNWLRGALPSNCKLNALEDLTRSCREKQSTQL